MKSSYIEIIHSLRLFANCDKNLIDNHIISHGKLKSFRSGENMTDHSSGESPSVGVLLSGRGVIYSSDKGRQTLLRFVSPGEAVGVASLFAANPPDTRIMACGDGKSEMFFISRDAFEALLSVEENGTFRNNLLKFLSDKVAFLNSRIDCVTAGSAERRLALFLKTSPKDSTGNIIIGMSMTSLAHALDIGRASLYRAFDSLEESGIIRRDGGTVVLVAPNKLDEIC